MKKSDLTYYLIGGTILILFLLLAYTNRSKDKKLDWSDSYSSKDKIPYGSFVLFDRLIDIYPEIPVDEIQQTPYMFLEWENEYLYYPTCYLFINSYFSPDISSWDALLNYVYMGNEVFIAADFFSNAVSDSLKFEVSEASFEIQVDSTQSGYLNPELSSHQEYLFFEPGLRKYFSSIDSTNSIALALNNEGETHFVKIQWGDGTFWISTTPKAYTNYHLLYTPQMDDYVSTSLSFLSSANYFYWDEYYKLPSMKRRSNQQSPLRFIHTQPSLTWAFWLLVASLILFILFESKRKQRIIPTLTPLANTSVEFTETMGRVYFRQQNHVKLIQKKIQILLDRIRSRFNLPTQQLDETFILTLSSKSGMELEKTRTLVNQIKQLQKRDQATEQELYDLNKEIESFYQYL